MIEIILLGLGVIIFSGIFAGIEAAILNITPAEVEDMVQKKLAGASILASARQQLTRSITTVLIWNNIINIAGSIFVGQAVVLRYGSGLLGVVTTAMTFGIIIFSDVVPKSLATRYARTVSRLAAPLVMAMNFLFLPVSWPIEQLLKFVTKGERTIGTEDQIRSLVRIGHRGGLIEPDERQLIHRVFNLNDVKAQDLMVGWDKIVALPESMTVGEAGPKIIDDPHSRFPLHGKSLDQIRGIVLETEILAAYTQNKLTLTLDKFIRPVLFVDPNTKADKLLILFRGEKNHMAIVRDKTNKTLGLVTLEDVLEELVGEIEDELDHKVIT
jgi:putative hemolysin